MSVYQVSWLPGSDHLLGRCHCGAERLAADPIEVWSWLLSHPSGHQADDAAPAGTRRPVGATR